MPVLKRRSVHVPVLLVLLFLGTGRTVFALTGLEHYGYQLENLHNGVSSEDIDFVSNYSNTHFVNDAFAIYQAGQRGTKSIVDASFTIDWKNTPQAQWPARLDLLEAKLNGLEQHIAAIMIVDEPYAKNYSFSTLNAATNALKARFPTIPITADFLYWNLNSTDKIPANIDWITTQVYPFDWNNPNPPSNPQAAYNSVMGNALNKLRTVSGHLDGQGNQKPIYIFGQAFSSYASNFPDPDWQQWYFDTAEAESDVIGLSWFVWDRAPFFASKGSDLIPAHQSIGSQMGVPAPLALPGPSGNTVVILGPDGASPSTGTGSDGGLQSGYVNAQTGVHAVVWNGAAGNVRDIHPVAFKQSWVIGSGGGKQAGYARTITGGYHAGVWSGTAASFVDLHPAGKNASFANGTDGVSQVGDADGSAALWTGTAASYVDIGSTISWTTSSWARDVEGTVAVGGYTHPGGAQFNNAGIWAFTGGTWSGGYLYASGYQGQELEAINGAQKVGHAIEQSSGNRHAVLWIGTALPTDTTGNGDDMTGFYTMIDLNPTGATASIAMDSDGTYQSGFATFSSADHAGLWSGSAASFMDLHLLLGGGYNWSQAYEVSTVGGLTQVIGFAENTVTGKIEAVMWNIPEPTSLALLATGGMLMFVHRRRLN